MTASEDRRPSIERPRIPRKVQLGDEIAAYVRDMIMSGRLRSGEQVHMDALARDIQTSVSPVREALLVLLGEGFVVREARRGFRVASLTREDISDLYFAQSWLAGELAARAAKSGGPALAKQITDIQARLKEASEHGPPEEVERLNDQFHRALNRAADAPKLSWLLDVVVRYVPRRFFSTIPGWLDASTHDHDAIVAAVQQGDGEKARTAMSSHIGHAGRLLVEHLEQQGFWEERA